MSGRRTSGQINERRRRKLPQGTAVNRRRDRGKRRSWKNGKKKRIRRRLTVQKENQGKKNWTVKLKKIRLRATSNQKK